MPKTSRTILPFHYVRELRDILREGQTFGSWSWAQGALFRSALDNDWFKVEPSMIDKNDPDCVWRKRKNDDDGTREICELWSPVRAVALYVALELPLPPSHVRLLDSGEADTWTYEGGLWNPNPGPLARGSATRPVEQGVFRRIPDLELRKPMTGLFINSNMTAAANKNMDGGGYVIPWQNEEVLYWLEKLRRWQQKYNPISAPTPWMSLQQKHLRGLESGAVPAAGRAACFLFRHAAAREVDDRAKPLPCGTIELLWDRLLAELERRWRARGETLSDGSGVRLVAAGRTKRFPLHSLRVSLTTAYLDAGVPPPLLRRLHFPHSNQEYYSMPPEFNVGELSRKMNETVTRFNETEISDPLAWLRNPRPPAETK